MNDSNQISVGVKRHAGRIYLVLGLLVALAGPVLYAGQLQAKVLSTPWYAPILGTVGLLLLVLAMRQSRSIWRWLAAGFVTLFAAFEWVWLLVLVGAPTYTGPVKAGQFFPEFATTLADGSPFTRESMLRGGRQTVMVFFRGRW
jgi:hypothetical protein